MLRIQELKLPLDHPEPALRQAILKRLGVSDQNLVSFTVFKRAYDARKTSAIQLIYTIDADVKEEPSVLKRLSRDKQIVPTPDLDYRPPLQAQSGAKRPVVVGMGPCGLFAGLLLAEMGFNPIILERGKIVRERYPDLSDHDQEAIRQHAVAAMNVTQQAKLELSNAASSGDEESQGSTALLDGVRKFVNVRDLDIELIDKINPFDAAYSVLAKSMDEKLLRQVQATIEAKKVSISEVDARDLAKRALQFKMERGRLPDINSADAWEKRMAEGVAALSRYRAQAKAAEAKNNNG